MSTPVKIAVVYHSGFGHTKFQAEAVAQGAGSVASAEVKLMAVDAIDWDFLDVAHAHIYGAPTYMGSLSAPFKAFMDETGGRWMKGAWADKLAAGFSNSGSLSGDKLQSLVQLGILAAQHGMIWVSNVAAQTGRGSDDVNRIGSFFGAMAQSNHGEASPAPGDLKTAEILGARVARAAQRWNAAG